MPEKLVWDREGAIAPAGRPTESVRRAPRQLGVGWVILDAGDAQAKGLLERSHRFMRTTASRAGGSPTRWTSSCSSTAGCDRVNRRVQRTVRAVPAERLREEQGRMRPVPETLPDCDSRRVVRVPQQPYLRLDRNDCSIDPAFTGGRVEVRVSQTEVVAVVLDSGELACRHRCSFACGLTVTDAAHQTQLERQRAGAAIATTSRSGRWRAMTS